MTECTAQLKLFISAYACEPGKGSEIGVGWHWVLEMSRYFELWVLTRANNRTVIEAYFSKHSETGSTIHWVYYDLPNFIKRFKHQMQGVRIYYTLWQYGSNHLVKEVMEKEQIEIFHLLTYGNAIWHISSYGQKKVFIWGPTGGTDTIPGEFSRHYTMKHRLVEAVRRAVVGSLPSNPSFLKKCKNASLIFCKAESVYYTIPKAYRGKAILFTDVAMEKSPEDFRPVIRGPGSHLTFITVGRLDGWRGFDLLVEAFSRAAEEETHLTMKIIGEGAEMRHLQRQILRLGMERKIILTGQITMEQYQREMKNCDAVLNSCLKEGGVTNAFDCMTWGKPLLCVDTGGYTRNFNSQCAIILPRTGREELIENLKAGMLRLCDHGIRRSMSEAMIRQGESVTWKRKGMQIRDEIMRVWNRKREEGI